MILCPKRLKMMMKRKLYNKPSLSKIIRFKSKITIKSQITIKATISPMISSKFKSQSQTLQSHRRMLQMVKIKDKTEIRIMVKIKNSLIMRISQIYQYRIMMNKPIEYPKFQIMKFGTNWKNLITLTIVHKFCLETKILINKMNKIMGKIKKSRMHLRKMISILNKKISQSKMLLMYSKT